ISATYSAADFQKEGRQKIKEITEKVELPIIVGGTGLYIQSLLYEVHIDCCEINDLPEIRETYNLFAEEKGRQALWQLIQQKDP
ncbi:tRNA (adenosine(37)-N6)-dimethylallyltransferase MiaA, partial [Enterococcus faecalis]